VLGSVDASQLDKTGCCQALRQVLPVHLHGKALPKLLQSFEFASWFAIFWICQNFVFWMEGNIADGLPGRKPTQTR